MSKKPISASLKSQTMSIILDLATGAPEWGFNTSFNNHIIYNQLAKFVLRMNDEILKIVLLKFSYLYICQPVFFRRIC